KKGMYIALPTEDSIQICVMSDMGLCTMKNALYPTDMVEWCIYALYVENEERIDKYCKYEFRNTDRNYARGLGGFLWIISAVVTEKLQVRCLTDTRVVDIRPPIEIVYVGNGCEGYSLHLYIPAKSTLTSEINIYKQGNYFLQFNAEYDRNNSIGIWSKLKFRLQSEQRAKKEVHTWAELQPMTYEYLNQWIDEIDLKYPVELPTKALLLCLIAVTGIISIVGVMAFCKWWKGHKNHKQIKEVIKLFSAKEIVKQLAKQNMIKKQTESLEEIPRLVTTAPTPNSGSAFKSDVETQRIEPMVVAEHIEPLYAAADPRPTLSASEDSVEYDNAVEHQQSVPADLEPLRAVLRQVVKDAHTADHYAKYVSRKSQTYDHDK
ncbi:MAG: hypothetical protein MJE68_06845, partial [Proteobacteria bacterium]|nr:hypothetical protein [Pseudomonadota bacterium]